MSQPLIMLVEDDEGIRDAYKEVLEEEGYVVEGYANGRDALTALASKKPLPALILLDWMMPVMTGEQFIRSECGREVSEKSPVVVISAVATQIGEVPGVKEYINKPIDIDCLLETVEHYCSPSHTVA